MENRRTNENKAITIYDIAREAEVSVSTVSRVLTGSANVKQEKREKIQVLIDKYNFKPNAMAKGLSYTKRKIIGIIAADVRNVYYANVFASCEMAAREAGYTVLLCNSFGEKENEKDLLEMLYEERVGCIIQLGGMVDDLVSDMEYVEKVNMIINNIPMVVTGKLDGTMCYQVQIDAMKAVDLIMEHLIDLGHKSIALVGGRFDVQSTFEKLQRYKQVLKNYRLDYHEEYVKTGSYDYETGYEKTNELLELSYPPTAIIAINDYAAAGIIRSIVEHSMRVPDDISVVSYDNTDLTKILTPRLTSVDYGYVEYGKTLVTTALAAIEAKSVPRIQFLTPQLVVRESTAMATTYK